MKNSTKSATSKSKSMNLQNNESTVRAAGRTAATGQTKNNFPCTQNQLYRLCYLAYKNYQENIDAFSRFRAIYTSDWGKDKVKAVDEARAMKNVQERNFQTSKSRLVLTTASRSFCENWLTLRQYVINTFGGEALDINLIAVGNAFYAKAYVKDWEALTLLLQNSTSYINFEKDELMGNNNMPADFISTFLASADACNALLMAYKDLTLIKKKEANKKTTANNDIYKDLIAMLADGRQIVFKKDRNLRDSFTFVKLYEIIKSQSPASLKGRITDLEGKPVAGAVLTIQRTELTAITNKQGYYSFNRLAGDNPFIVDITKKDFIPRHEGVILKPGTAKHLDLHSCQSQYRNQYK